MQADVFTAAVQVAQRVGHRNVTRKLLCEQMRSNNPSLGDEAYVLNWIGNYVNMADLKEHLYDGSHQLKLPAGNPEKRGQGQVRSAGYTPEWIAKNRQRILDASLMLAERHGYRGFTRQQVSEETQTAAGIINRQQYFGSMEGLREAVMLEAVRTGNLRVIAQGLVDGHSATAGIDPELKEAAIRALAS